MRTSIWSLLLQQRHKTDCLIALAQKHNKLAFPKEIILYHDGAQRTHRANTVMKIPSDEIESRQRTYISHGVIGTTGSQSEVFCAVVGDSFHEKSRVQNSNVEGNSELQSYKMDQKKMKKINDGIEVETQLLGETELTLQ